MASALCGALVDSGLGLIAESDLVGDAGVDSCSGIIADSSGDSNSLVTMKFTDDPGSSSTASIRESR